MARQPINIGSSANDGTGDPLRTAFDKINDNFVELYGTDNDINTLDANLNVNTFAITTGVTNGDITVTPNGTGSIKLGAMKFNGTTLSSDDSTIININEGLVVDGTANISGATTLGSTLSVGTSLALATGATVTGIDNGALGTSATLLATQGAIKTYVDAQVTASDLDFACDDSTTLSIDLDSESWIGTSNMAVPYTELESNMLKSAYKAVGSEWEDLNDGDMTSNELPSINKQSPVEGFKGYPR